MCNLRHGMAWVRYDTIRYDTGGDFVPIAAAAVTAAAAASSSHSFTPHRRPDTDRHRTGSEVRSRPRSDAGAGGWLLARQVWWTDRCVAQVTSGFWYGRVFTSSLGRGGLLGTHVLHPYYHAMPIYYIVLDRTGLEKGGPTWVLGT